MLHFLQSSGVVCVYFLTALCYQFYVSYQEAQVLPMFRHKRTQQTRAHKQQGPDVVASTSAPKTPELQACHRVAKGSSATRWLSLTRMLIRRQVRHTAGTVCGKFPKRTKKKKKTTSYQTNRVSLRKPQVALLLQRVMIWLQNRCIPIEKISLISGKGSMHCQSSNNN